MPPFDYHASTILRSIARASHSVRPHKEYTAQRKRAPRTAPVKFIQGGLYAYADKLKQQIVAESRRGLCRVVHFELDRVRGVLEAYHFAHFQVDVSVDEVIIEHAASFEEGAVLVELFKRLAQ
jgi:hypothetical protein